jgi:hypothetical protein
MPVTASGSRAVRSQHVSRGNRPQPHGRAQGAPRGGQRDQGRGQDRQEPAGHVHRPGPAPPPLPGRAAGPGRPGLRAHPVRQGPGPVGAADAAVRRARARHRQPVRPGHQHARLPHQRDRLRHHRAGRGAAAAGGRGRARHPPRLRLDPRGHARVRARAAQLRRADRPARLRVPRFAGAALPRPLRLRGRPGQPPAEGRPADPGRPGGAAARRPQLRHHPRHPDRPGHGRAVGPPPGAGGHRRVPAAAVPGQRDRSGHDHPRAARPAGGGAARPDGGGPALRPGRADRDPLVAPGPGHHPRARLAAPDADRGGGVAAAGGGRANFSFPAVQAPQFRPGGRNGPGRTRPGFAGRSTRVVR